MNHEPPLIVQTDRTVLLETQHPDYEAARDRLSRFAELEKSPEYVHFYRITPISGPGFIAGTAGAFVLLLFYRILSNSYIVEAADGSVPSSTGTTITYYSRRRRRKAA